MIYSLSPLFQPQYVGNAAAELVFATTGSPIAVPSSVLYQILTARVANITGAPVSLEVWRVPSGGARGNSNIVCPPINIPAATQTSPYFDLTALWGVVLQSGDKIYALAGAASSLVIQGDGAVITA